MTQEEIEIFEMLGECWNKFILLEVQHDSDAKEFCSKIHDLQNMVLARTGYRHYKKQTLDPRLNINENACCYSK